jgi:hypothetical protein
VCVSMYVNVSVCVCLCGGGGYILKSPLHSEFDKVSKYTRALTFENLCKGKTQHAEAALILFFARAKRNMEKLAFIKKVEQTKAEADKLAAAAGHYFHYSHCVPLFLYHYFSCFFFYSIIIYLFAGHYFPLFIPTVFLCFPL